MTSPLRLGDALRVPAAGRARRIEPPLLDGMHVWLRLAHRELADVQTYVHDLGLIVLDESDDAELHLVLAGDLAVAVLVPELDFGEQESW